MGHQQATRVDGRDTAAGPETTKGRLKASLVIAYADLRSRKCRFRRGDVEAGKQLVRSGGVERVVTLLGTDKFRFQVTNTLLEPSILGEQSGIGATDITEKRLRHERVLHAENE